MKKTFLLLSSFVLLIGLVKAENYSQELQEAYNFAYQNKITTISSIDNANMYGGLTRIAMAKMLSQYAINILGKVPDTSKVPNFGDVDSKLDVDYNNGVTLAYQLGIMGIGIDKFRPFDYVTRAEFGTALSRVLYGTKNEGGNPYYIEHLKALQTLGIMTQINQPNQLEIRGYVMLMLMRSNGNESSKIINNISNDDFYDPYPAINPSEVICTKAGYYPAKFFSYNRRIIKRGCYPAKSEISDMESPTIPPVKPNDEKCIYKFKGWKSVSIFSKTSFEGWEIRAEFECLNPGTNSENQLINDSVDNYQYSGGILTMTVSPWDYKQMSVERKLFFKLIVLYGKKDTYGEYPKVYSIEFKKIGNLDINFIDSIRIENGYETIITNKLSGVSSDIFKLDVKDKYQTIFSRKSDEWEDRRRRLYVKLKNNNLPDSFTLGFTTNYIDHTCNHGCNVVIYDDNDLFVYNNKSLDNNAVTDDGSTLNNDNLLNSGNSPEEVDLLNDENSFDSNSSSNSNTSGDNVENFLNEFDNISVGVNHCTAVEVDNGNAYDFCIKKLSDTNFRMSVNNSEGLSKCIIGKGGQTWDFSNCEGQFTVLGAQGQSNLRLTVKYNNKSYSKTVPYDFDNGNFVNNGH